MNMVEYAPVAPATESEPTLDELREQLDDARTQWATISSKRQNRLFERRIHGYNDAQEQYNQLVIDYGRMELAEALASADNEAEKRRLTVAYILEQQNELRALTDETMESKRGRKFGRSIGKFLTSGSRKAQFAKGALLTGIAGATGGLVGAGIAGIAAINFAKGYVTSEVRGLGETDVDAAQLLDDEETEHSVDTLLERAQMKSAELFDIDGKEQQSQRRKAAKRGLGVMATGMAFGGIVGLTIDGFTMPGASATPGSETYSNPGMVDTHSNPGMTDVAMESHSNPGMVEVSADTQSNPGMIGPVAENMRSNPGMADVASHSNPDMVPLAESRSNPGMIYGTESHSNPDMVASQDGGRSNPGMIDMNETRSNPGMIDMDTHTNPGMGETPSESSEGFTVEYGNGYTHELMQAAAANGVEMSADQAWAAHQVIVDTLGTADYIDLTDHSGNDTYSMGETQYETGISAPGEATWSPEALELVNDATDDGVIDGVDAPHVESPAETPTPTEVEPQTDSNGPNAEERQETGIVERSGLEGLQEAQQDNENWTEMQRDMQRMESLLQAGDFETVNDTKAFQDTLEYIAHDTEGMTYPGSNSEILSWDATTERWAINPIPDGSYIPKSVIDVVGAYQQSLLRLAA